MKTKNLLMRYYPMMLALILVAVGSGGVSFAEGKLSSEGGETAKMPFAVVELFTSEGCSSCPPADRLLSELASQALEEGGRIFPLSFHVDYWNYIGWKDPFSDRAYSDRQRSYARAFGSRGIYTPQMVVNGVVGFVGSDRTRARSSIEQVLSIPAPVGLVLKYKVAMDSDPLVVEYELSDYPRGAVLNLALVERGLVREVTRGENAGRTLHHENVVRLFKTVQPRGDGKGRIELKPDNSVVRENSAIIGYVQDPTTMTILGSALLELGS